MKTEPKDGSVLFSKDIHFGYHHAVVGAMALAVLGVSLTAKEVADEAVLKNLCLRLDALGYSPVIARLAADKSFQQVLRVAISDGMPWFALSAMLVASVILPLFSGALGLVAAQKGMEREERERARDSDGKLHSERVMDSIKDSLMDSIKEVVESSINPKEEPEAHTVQ